MSFEYEASVYVVGDSIPYEGFWIRCIFTTLDAANEWVDSFGEEYTVIIEVETDPPIEPGRESGQRGR